MSSDPKSPTVREPETDSADEQFRRDRRKLFADALVGVPVILTLTSKPLWAGVAGNMSNQTGCRYLQGDAFEAEKCSKWFKK